MSRLPTDDPLFCPISLFGTIDYGRMETAHTNALAWLLDPSRPHDFGDSLLRSLLSWYKGTPHVGQLHRVKVANEYLISGGRLDIHVEGEWEDSGATTPWVLIVEAKIDAWEGEDQLPKYDKWLAAHARGRLPLRIFLTADGRLPAGSDEWKPMSFLQMVQVFRKTYSDLKEAAGFHFLRFYLAGVLQDICGFSPAEHATALTDPYSLASYLETVQQLTTKDAKHDATRQMHGI
jgi:hypothetical protein